MPSASFAWAGIWTDFVTPWRVRSPTSVTSVAVPARAAAGISTGWVSVKVAVAKASVSRPSERSRLSRRSSSDVIVVVSTVMLPSVKVAVVPSDVSVMEPVTSVVRPTASVSASNWASCSRTR